METRKSTSIADTPEAAGQAAKFNVSGVRSLRSLSVLSCATKLARLDMRFRSAGDKTDTVQLYKWRDQGLTAEWIHRVVRQEGELLWPVQRAMKLVHCLTEGSPRLRAIFRLVQNHGVLEAADTAQYRHHQKALIVECCPLNAWCLEVVLNAALIGTRAMHAKLHDQERRSLIDNFNNPNSSLKVMIITYDIGSVGLSCYAKPKQFENEEGKLKFYDNYNVEDRDSTSPDSRI
ncbi:SNF2-like protein [Penicillium mononematosum]|uniref:SNF2-like protein n=1 Tax=Penicillium mononematosum TaxID=268346 RepID=UPI0025480551|nr:SNF2-like protein [Penicillium mononematosum]KAJ6187742.1 SNF2-like protein [Penicillium mononematosum]